MINVEERKKLILYELLEVENDIARLTENIEAFRKDMESVVTEEDAMAFDQAHDLEAGLIHIRLY